MSCCTQSIVDLRGLGSHPGLLQQESGPIDAGDVKALPGKRDGEPARAAAEIEDLEPLRMHQLDEPLDLISGFRETLVRKHARILIDPEGVVVEPLW